jgi:hypothetical protein
MFTSLCSEAERFVPDQRNTTSRGGRIAGGNVFAGPSVGDSVEAMRAADGGEDVLRLYGNYGGDRMNFDVAGEMLEIEGMATTTVLGADDVASAGPDEREKRRGDNKIPPDAEPDRPHAYVRRALDRPRRSRHDRFPVYARKSGAGKLTGFDCDSICSAKLQEP